MTVSTTVWAVRTAWCPLALAGLLVATGTAIAPARETLPEAIAAPGAAIILTAHAVGAQIYECMADADGKPAWRFREPIATLLIDGRTVGRHFAGPGWELADGSRIVGKVVAQTAGATADDIAWLKLAGSDGRGQFANVNVIQRVNTRGGALAGACDKAGELKAVPYAGDYIFSAKGD
jgi:hypothetical protein